MPGNRISAIATVPQYGTSEPAQNAAIFALGENAIPDAAVLPILQPQCLSRPEPNPAVPEPLRLEVPRSIHFALDADRISVHSMVLLDQIAAVLRAHPMLVVDLQGHTDSRASAAYNQDLARRRAENARRYLIRQGVAPERLTIRALGELTLAVEEITPTDYARNRRVEFIFQDVRGLEITFVDSDSDLQVEP